MLIQFLKMPELTIPTCQNRVFNNECTKQSNLKKKTLDNLLL
jgi:hypothetical protein